MSLLRSHPPARPPPLFLGCARHADEHNLRVRAGHTQGSAGTLARHVPIADLGTGRLHRNLESKALNCAKNSDQGGHWGRKGNNMRGGKHKNTKTPKSPTSKRQEGSNSSSGDGDSKNDHRCQSEQKRTSTADEEKEKGSDKTSKTLPLRQGSLGDIEQRRRQGEGAVWGGRTARSGHTLEQEEADTDRKNNWWETETQYAFQPCLPVVPCTARSTSHFVRGGGTTGGGEGGGEIGHEKGAGGTGGENGIVLHVVKPAEVHADRGKKVFFLVS